MQYDGIKDSAHRPLSADQLIRSMPVGSVFFSVRRCWAEGFAAAFGSMLSELAIPLLLLPGFFLLRQYPGDSISGCCIRLCGKWIGKLLTALYLAFF